jgi:endonuclease/exonuclease/phosphatase family metal-dependent hydrolase
VVGLAAVFSVAGVSFNSAKPGSAPEGDRLRVLTYNIQQGYSADGQRSYAGQLELMRQVNVGLIGLQESDTNRIAGGNADLVRYFADRLDLYSYYGPKTVNGTFGIALLSKYPLRNPRTFYMYSSGEQTAGIAAQVEVSGRTFNVYVTHLGNGGPLIQQQQLLSDIKGKANVIAMGDFNFEPGSEQYILTAKMLADAWMVKWPSGGDDSGYNPADRIDHIFLSPNLNVLDARHLTGPQSDHPVVWAEIGW